MRMAEEIISRIMEVHVYNKQINQGTCLTYLDKDRGRGGQIKLIWGSNVKVKVGPRCIWRTMIQRDVINYEIVLGDGFK